MQVCVMMRVCGKIVLGLLFCGMGAAQQPWQQLNNPSRAEVASTWKTPPAEYGPEPYYGLNGAITLDVVRRDLDTMKALGYRAVVMQYGFGSDRAYLSPEYMAFFREVVHEVSQREMRLWIVDDAGYPSGFAGGKFSAEHPELRMQALVATQKKQIAAGESFDAALSANTVAVTAVGADGALVQIPVVQGHAHWTAPAGAWTVVVVEHGFRTSATRSDTNPKRTKDGTQSLEDYLDPAATAQYLAFTHEAYRKVVGDEFGKTILGFRGDEPDYSIAGLPWTPKFFEAFRAKKGYEVRPYLAALVQAKDAPLTEEQRRVRADYYDVFADLFRDGFFKPQADWCAAHGLEYQMHLNHEEQQIELARSEGDFFRAMRFVQVPGIDAIWHQIWTDTVSDFPRLASSAAHVYGHPHAFTESFAAYRPLPDAAMARYILNEQFVRGINLMETMYFPASTDGKGGPMAFMREPSYPDLMHYSARMSYLMSQGRPAADVALLLSREDLWRGEVKTDATFVSTERLLSEHQVDFDVIDEDAIARLLPLEQGRFVSLSGNRYRAVIVPHAHLLPQAVVDRLHAFAASGGTVLFLGSVPALIAEKTNLDARATRPGEFAWATTVAVDLPVTPTPPAYPPTTAPAPMPVAPGVWQQIAQALPPNALTLAAPKDGLRMMHRRWKDATVYLLFNEAATAFSGAVRLAAGPGARVELWDVQAGAIAPVAARAAQKGFELDLNMEPYATRVLVVRSRASIE
jgi:hypothetical protein